MLLVLCVDLDDDLGRKTGFSTPVIGRDPVEEAAVALATADPEDSDVNVIFQGVHIYDDLAERDESVEVARMLESDGALDALELTGGSSLQNPMYLFRGEAPIHEMAASMPRAVALGLKLFGRFFFEEGYFRSHARQFRAALDLPLVLLGGINRRETIDQAMAEGFEFVALGRGLLRDPDLVKKMAEGETDASLCVHCNKCMATIYAGTHCVLVEEALRA